MTPWKFIALTAILPLMGCQHSTSEILHAPQVLEKMTVHIGEQSWTVDVAKTLKDRQQGLMLRESLEEGMGMLFIFEEEDFHAFWMKSTLIPLDVIWIGEDEKVVDVQTLQPCKTEECPNFRPAKKAKYVLEVNAGEFEGKVGEQIQITKN